MHYSLMDAKAAQPTVIAHGQYLLLEAFPHSPRSTLDAVGAGGAGLNQVDATKRAMPAEANRVAQPPAPMGATKTPPGSKGVENGGLVASKEVPGPMISTIAKNLKSGAVPEWAYARKAVQVSGCMSWVWCAVMCSDVQ